MQTVVLSSVICSIALLLINKLLYKDLPVGSDHGLHLNIIKRIKKNRHRFLSDYLLCYNERNPFYPQLYHFIVSFIGVRYLEENPKVLSRFLSVIEVLLFNTFIYYLLADYNFELTDYLVADLVFITFPFSYALWNAKNTGLSARQIGLISGQLYIYLTVIYLSCGEWYYMLCLYLISLVIILISQFATQYLLLTSILFTFFFSSPEFLSIPFVGFGLFYLIMPRIANNYVIGQYNHKRNYALYMADIFILKSRPSIYRDFYRDFWFELKKDTKSGLNYIYRNPLIELIYGFTYIWPLLLVFSQNELTQPWSILIIISFISLLIFLIISFRVTRFLGEPQRYMEFTLPLIAICFVYFFDLKHVIFLFLINLLLIFIPRKFILQEKLKKESSRSKQKLSDWLKLKMILKDSSIWASNDAELLKLFASEGIKICKPDFSNYYRSRDDFRNGYYDNHLGNISPSAIESYMTNFPLDGLIINRSIYDEREFTENLLLSHWSKEMVIENYKVFYN